MAEKKCLRVGVNSSSVPKSLRSSQVVTMIHAGSFAKAREEAIMAHYRHFGAPHKLLKHFENAYRGKTANPWVTCYLAENAVSPLGKNSRLHRQGHQANYTVEILYHQDQDQFDSKDPTSIFLPIPSDSLAHPWAPVECTERDCPVKTYHYQGLYMHRGSPCSELSHFGFGDPPPEVWEALKRIQVRQTQVRKADPKDQEMVDRFVDYHAWVCTRVGETDIEEESETAEPAET